MTGTDALLHSISNVQRRRLLVHILFHNPADDSKVYTGDMETSDTELTELLIQMEHTHLPLLDDYGFIDWDRENHVITKGPTFSEIRPVLVMLVRHEDELPDDWL